MSSTISIHVYEVRPRKDKRGVDLISDALPFGRLWYDGPNAASNAIGYASQYSRSHDAVIRVYDAAGNVIESTSTKPTSKRDEVPFAATAGHLARESHPHLIRAGYGSSRSHTLKMYETPPPMQQ